MAEAVDKTFWKDIWPLILKSPIAIFALVMNFLMGYMISFMLFDYRTNPQGHSHILHVAIGTGYSCLIFVVSCWSLIFSSSKPLKLEDIAVHCPRTIILSFAILIIITFFVIVFRERQGKSGGNDGN